MAGRVEHVGAELACGGVCVMMLGFRFGLALVRQCEAEFCSSVLSKKKPENTQP